MALEGLLLPQPFFVVVAFIMKRDCVYFHTHLEKMRKKTYTFTLLGNKNKISSKTTDPQTVRLIALMINAMHWVHHGHWKNGNLPTPSEETKGLWLSRNKKRQQTQACKSRGPKYA